MDPPKVTQEISGQVPPCSFGAFHFVFWDIKLSKLTYGTIAETESKSMNITCPAILVLISKAQCYDILIQTRIRNKDDVH